MNHTPASNYPAQLRELIDGNCYAPIFMPDATHGVIRGLLPDDLIRCGTQMLMMNGFHLANKPGISVVNSLGGLHELSNWRRPIATDSGGFQIYSLVRRDTKLGKIDDDGLAIRSDGRQKLIRLTPERAIINQLRLDSDLVFVLDECTHPDDSRDIQEQSVRRTIDWAKRAKKTFDTINSQREVRVSSSRPLLFAIIQGGRIPELRKWCASALLEIGFDGFGFGGWPFDSDYNLEEDMLSLVRELVPKPTALHALGIGHPKSIISCARVGYRLFDSSLPTRDARRGRLYTFLEERPRLLSGDFSWFDAVYIKDDKYTRCPKPLSPFCQQICCTEYTLGYLRHLSVLDDAAYIRLATLHNLAFIAKLMHLLGEEMKETIVPADSLKRQ